MLLGDGPSMPAEWPDRRSTNAIMEVATAEQMMRTAYTPNACML